MTEDGGRAFARDLMVEVAALSIKHGISFGDAVLLASFSCAARSLGEFASDEFGAAEKV